LATLSIAGALDLIVPSPGEANAEHAQGIVVSGFNINMCFDESLPFPHQGPQLVSSEVHPLKEKTSIYYLMGAKAASIFCTVGDKECPIPIYSYKTTGSGSYETRYPLMNQYDLQALFVYKRHENRGNMRIY
jgi:hypothetical protein